MLEFRVLGPFEVLRDGLRVDLGGPRRRAFLALLVLNAGRVLGTERLIDSLWGERPPRTAGHVLHVYASALRSVLEPGVLIARPPGYVLEIQPDTVDLVRFEQLVAAASGTLGRGDAGAALATLARATALWRGPMLEDLAYEEFVQPEARRLEELCLAARELGAEAGLVAGADAALVAALRALAAEHPLRERIHALLIRALAATGRQADALAAYDDVRRRLDDELGIEPGADLRAAQLAVLRQEVDVATHVRSATSAGGTVLAVAFDPTRLPELASVADAAAGGGGRELILGCVLDRAVPRPELTAAARAAVDAKSTLTSTTRTAAFRSTDPGVDVVALSAEHDVDLVVVDVDRALRSDGRITEHLRAILEGATCDVVLVAGCAASSGDLFAVPFGGAVHDWAAVEFAALAARGVGGGVRLIALETEEGDASRLVARAALAVQRAAGIDAEPVLAQAGADGLLAAAEGAAGMVVGISERWRSEGLGLLRAQLVERVPRVAIARRGLRPGLLAPVDARTRFTWSVSG